MAASGDGDGFRRKILLLCTAGGYTHAAPILELGAVLATRGHTIAFATNAGQEHWARPHAFIRTVHTFGPALPFAVDDARYVGAWGVDWSSSASAAAASLDVTFASRRILDANWADTHARLRRLCASPSTRPDFIVADFLSGPAATDMLLQHGVPVAVMWPQFPLAARPPYVPGAPGFQPAPATTSERLDAWRRLRNAVALWRMAPHVRAHARWTAEMRRRGGMGERERSPLGYEKLRFLVLVNLFVGLESPMSLPPLMAAVGPVLADAWAPLGGEDDDGGALERWLGRRRRVVYVSLGTHLVLPEERGVELMKGLLEVLLGRRQAEVDGVVWALPEVTGRLLDRGKRIAAVAAAGHGLEEKDVEITVGDVMDNKHEDFLVLPFAPQRAVLDHPHTTLFLTHAGGSSSNETAWHGVRVLCLPVWYDGLANAERLVEAGVGLKLDKLAFNSGDVVEKIETVMRDDDGMFAKNVQRLKRIARIAAKGKHRAADLIEEVLADWEGGAGSGERAMHLQTADCRMSAWKARNWDLMAVVMGIAAAVGGLIWWAVKALWLKRDSAGAVVRRL